MANYFIAIHLTSFPHNLDPESSFNFSLRDKKKKLNKNLGFEAKLLSMYTDACITLKANKKFCEYRMKGRCILFLEQKNCKSW